MLVYYARLVRYSVAAKPKVFHILWKNKFEFLDRTILMLYYKRGGEPKPTTPARTKPASGQRMHGA